jgi:hypothetical protein
MLHSAFVRRTFSLIVLFVLMGAEAVAEAEQPFFYYPAYGSSRGRIRYVDGVLRDKQRIKWGNGVTDNGVLVMRDIATAAGQILPAVLNNAPAPPAEEENHARAAHSLALAQDEQLQARAEEFLEANRKLLGKLGGSPGVSDPPVAQPTGKLQVLLLHESENLAEYTPEQLAVINSNKIRMYLNTHCDKVDGDSQWRRLDNDIPKDQLRDENLETWWERIKETKAKSGEKPWLVIYKDGVKVHDQELTSGEEETLQLLRSFGGN